jgi:hypothetical protein
MIRKQPTSAALGQRVRKSAGDHPPPIAKPMPPGTVRQSPLPEHVEVQAQKLIHETGSPGAAKTAVDVAADRELGPDFQEDNFALRWGFRSRAELLAASKPITAGDGSSWWATAIPSERWVVWNKEHMAAGETFGSLEEARGSLEQCAP